MTSRPHDALFKETFTDLDNARGELASILPPEVAAIVDWPTLRIEPGSFVDEALRETMSDLLFTVQMRGRDACLYLLFEHQSSPDLLMPLRALAYIVRVWNTWLREHPGAKRLPPVIPVVLAQVDGGWTAPTDLLDVIDFADDAERALLGPLVPRCTVLLDDLAFVSDAALDARPLPDHAKLALAALRDVRGSADAVGLLSGWAEWTRSLAATEQGRAALVPVLRYITFAARAVDEARFRAAVRSIHPKAEETIMTLASDWFQQGEAKGEAKGEARGEAKGRAGMLLRLLTLRFAPLSSEVVARVHAADIATLDAWAERVLTASTVTDVLGD